MGRPSTPTDWPQRRHVPGDLATARVVDQDGAGAPPVAPDPADRHRPMLAFRSAQTRGWSGRRPDGIGEDPTETLRGQREELRRRALTDTLEQPAVPFRAAVPERPARRRRGLAVLGAGAALTLVAALGTVVGMALGRAAAPGGVSSTPAGSGTTNVLDGTGGSVPGASPAPSAAAGAGGLPAGPPQPGSNGGPPARPAGGRAANGGPGGVTRCVPRPLRGDARGHDGLPRPMPGSHR